jgi:CRP/FNR family transcriptional regulator
MLVRRSGHVARLTGTYAAPKRTWYISAINLFEGIADSEIDACVERCGPRTFEAGQRIIDASTTPPELVLLVREGAVRLVLERARGRTETVDLLGPGQLFGVSAAFGGSPTRLHADALTRVVACVAEGKSFLIALATCPDIILNLVRQAGVRFMQFGSGYSQPPLQAADVRLAEVLRRLAMTGGEAVRGGWRIPACISRATLARQVGCTRETIARMLSSLESSGGIVRQGRSIVVDLKRLDAIVRSGRGIAIEQ